MSPTGSSVGQNRSEQPHQRLLDQAAILQEEAQNTPDQSLDRGADRTHAAQESVGLRKDVVARLMEEHPDLIPEHLQGDEEGLRAFLNGQTLEQKREALNALQRMQEEAKGAKEKGWLSGALTNIKEHFQAHWGKYLIAAAVIGAGWYFSDYIFAWLKQMQGLVTQGAIDTGASQVVSTAPTTVASPGGADLTALISNNPLGPTSGYPATVQPPINNLFTGGGGGALPVTPDINAALGGLSQ